MKEVGNDDVNSAQYTNINRIAEITTAIEVRQMKESVKDD